MTVASYSLLPESTVRMASVGPETELSGRLHKDFEVRSGATVSIYRDCDIAFLSLEKQLIGVPIITDMFLGKLY